MDGGLAYRGGSCREEEKEKELNWVAAWKIDLGAVAQGKASSSLVSFRYVCYAKGLLMQHIMFQFPSMNEAHMVELFFLMNE